MSPPATAEAQRRNVELVQRYLRYQQDGRAFAVAEELETFLHPEVEWMPGLMPMGKAIYKGREEFRRYIQEAEKRAGNPPGFLNVDETRPFEDWVLVLGWVHYVDAEGESLENDYALLIRFEDGLFKSMRSFSSRDEAERAAADA